MARGDFKLSAVKNLKEKISNESPIQKEEDPAVINTAETKENTVAIQEETQQRSARSILDELEKESKIPKAFDLRYIPREKIITNEKNDYEQNEIEKLSKKILEFGLIHNLEAFYDVETDLYTLESGERRFRAISLLIDTYQDYEDTESEDYKYYLKNVKMFEAGYPVNVKRKVSGDELENVESEIRLYIANEEQRERNAAKTLERINHLNELIERRNELKGIKGSNTTKLAEELNMTPRQVQKYQSLNDLIPELMEEFKKSNITVAEGANYAKLTPEEQMQILSLIQNNSSKSEIENLSNELKANRKLIEEKEKELEKATSDHNSLKRKLEELESNKEEEIRLAKEAAKEDAKASVDNDLQNKNSEISKLQKESERSKDELSQKEHEILALKHQLEEMKKPVKNDDVKIDSTRQALIREDVELNKLIDVCTKDISTLVASIRQYDKNYDEEIVNDLNTIKRESLLEALDKLKRKLEIKL